MAPYNVSLLWTRRQPNASPVPSHIVPLGRLMAANARTDGALAATTLAVEMDVLGGDAFSQQLWWSSSNAELQPAIALDGIDIHASISGEFAWVLAQLRDDVDLLRRSEVAYRHILERVRTLDRPHLLRVWNYIPRINAIEDGEERYRTFNRGRRAAFRAAGYENAASVPAACALGTHRGQVRIAVLASRQPVVTIENPRQVSAYHYPRQYGEDPPLFSRAAWFPQPDQQDVLFISGTASIVGHETLHPGDVQAQTRESLLNIAAVLQAANRHAGSEVWQMQNLSGCVYVRDPAHYLRVRALLEAQGLTQFCYLHGDICRSDLLVEIEAEAHRGGAV